jgi:hypothetical protein
MLLQKLRTHTPGDRTTASYRYNFLFDQHRRISSYSALS